MFSEFFETAPAFEKIVKNVDILSIEVIIVQPLLPYTHIFGTILVILGHCVQGVKNYIIRKALVFYFKLFMISYLITAWEKINFLKDIVYEGAYF